MRWAWFFGGTTAGLLVVAAWLAVGALRPSLLPGIADVPGALTLATATPPALPTSTPAAAGTPIASAPTRAAAGAPAGPTSPAPVPTTSAPSSAPAPPSAAAPTPGGPGAVVPPPPAAAPAVATPSTQARVGELVSSGVWRLLVLSQRREGPRILVDLVLKNDGDHAAVLAVPSTAPSLPGGGFVSFPLQITGPPTLDLRVVDAAGKSYGGSFVASTGQTSGSYTFVAAPGDAIRLTYAFEMPSGSPDPLGLDLKFGGEAGGLLARVKLGERADPPAQLAPSDEGKVAKQGERVQVDDLWAFTLNGIDVGDGGVTAHVKFENLSDDPLVPGGTLNDPTGADRDFYAVDGATRLAYSSSETMPTGVIAPGQSRTVDVRMRAPTDFAKSGPIRFSIVVDAERDRYAVFRVG